MNSNCTWISNCNYTILGSIYLVSTIISFEINLFFLVFRSIILIERFSFSEFIIYKNKIKFAILLYPLYLIMFPGILIELNRTPFDSIQRESELISGFNIEYHRRIFVLISLSEYINIIFIRVILRLIFYGFDYWSIKFIIYLYLSYIYLIIWVIWNFILKSLW